MPQNDLRNVSPAARRFAVDGLVGRFKRAARTLNCRLSGGSGAASRDIGDPCGPTCSACTSPTVNRATVRPSGGRYQLSAPRPQYRERPPGASEWSWGRYPRRDQLGPPRAGDPVLRRTTGARRL